MSNTKKEKINITTIPEDKVIELKIGGLYYQRLNKLLIDFGDSVSKQQLLQSMAKIQRGIVKGDDHFTFNLETLIILLHNVEKAFQEAGHTVENEVEIELPKEFEEMKTGFSNENKNDD